jgi:hypothetical protein
LLLQYVLQLGDGELGIAPQEMSLRVLDALLRRRLLAGADGEQSEQETSRQSTSQPRAACARRTAGRTNRRSSMATYGACDAAIEVGSIITHGAAP